MARFLLVGVSNAIVSFTVYHLCYRARVGTAMLDLLPGAVAGGVRGAAARFGAATIDAGVANACGYAAGTLNSFVWNRTWTFGVVDRARRRFVRFVALNLAGLLLSSTAVFVAVDSLGWPYVPAWLVVGGGVTVLNYLGNRHWVFGDRAVADEAG